MQEFALIEHFRRASAAHAAVELGIGDDAAVLRATSPDARTLVTVDLLAEGTHFLIPPATPREIGHKLLGVNLSDIAAMAGRPEAAFVALLLPRSRGAEFALEMMAGVQALADRHGVAIAGGDTNTWDGPLVASLTLTGSPGAAGPVRRSGAQPGDWLLVSGPLGGSLSGRHLRVQPRVAEAQRLVDTVAVHAMIDLSDGLSRDLRHITVEQGLGGVVDGAAVPVHPDVEASLPAEQRLAHALHDGEDFELLLAVSPDDGERLLRQPPPGLSLTRIGECTAAGEPCRLRGLDGRLSELSPQGYEHGF